MGRLLNTSFEIKIYEEIFFTFVSNAPKYFGTLCSHSRVIAPKVGSGFMNTR
jgi:hypothetical protein